MKTDINDLNDIVLFVDIFYGKVRNDDLIGPVFNHVILDWPTHLGKMYRFWNAALFGVAGYKGNPFAKHAPLAIDEKHFERWLSLFHGTIDEHFEGAMAADTKDKAVKMARMFLLRLNNMKGGADKVIV